MSLEELKSQVEAAIRQLFLALRSREREALDFIQVLVRRFVNVDLNGEAEGIDERASSPDCREDCLVSPTQTAVPAHKTSPVRSKRKRPRRINQEIKPFDVECISPSPIQTPVPTEKSSKRKSRKTHQKTKSPDVEHVSSHNEEANEISENKQLLVHCCICSEFATSRAMLPPHYATHPGAGVSCRTCRHTFRNLTTYTLHLALRVCVASKQRGGSFVFNGIPHLDKFDFKHFAVCPFCALRFSKATNLRLHMRRSICLKSESKQGVRFVCTRCKRVFDSSDQLDAHVKNVHSHKCTKCEEVFDTVARMKAHRITHVKNHKCSKCSEIFPTRVRLKTHDAKAHRADKTNRIHACKMCGWKTNRAYNLTRHMRSAQHDGGSERAGQFACHRCPVVLRSWETLKNHLIAHSEEYAFVCEYCNKGFKYKTNLKRHILRHASLPAILHACSRCDKTFVRRDHLRRHEREVHEMKRKCRAKAIKAPSSGAAGGVGGGGGAAGGGEVEAQFMSLLDVQSGEMFSVPSHYAHLLMEGTPVAPLGAESAWEGLPGAEAVPEVGLQYTHNIVLLTNVPSLPCIPLPADTT